MVFWAMCLSNLAEGQYGDSGKSLMIVISNWLTPWSPPGDSDTVLGLPGDWNEPSCLGIHPILLNLVFRKTTGQTAWLK